MAGANTQPKTSSFPNRQRPNMQETSRNKSVNLSQTNPLLMAPLDMGNEIEKEKMKIQRFMNIREQSVRCMAERQLKYEDILKKAEMKLVKADKNRKAIIKDKLSTLGERAAEAQ